MDTYRKITQKELLDLANTIKYWDQIPVDDICYMVTEIYGERARYVIVGFGDEYNDESYELKIQTMEVMDADNKEMPLPFNEDDWKDPRYDRYHDLKHGIKIGGESYDGFGEINPVLIDIEAKKIMAPKGALQDLYVKENL